jgi:hypothetical protein
MSHSQQIHQSASARRDLIEARQMTNGQHVRSFLGTFDGYVYARGATFILRRKEAEAMWHVFCGTDAWPVGADERTVIAQQLADAPYLNGEG